MEKEINPHAQELGRLGGRARSERKAKAVRANGKKGGRPRKHPPCPKYRGHRFRNGRCYFCGYAPNWDSLFSGR